MNPGSFTSPAGQLIEVRRGDRPYWSFIPNPLPPAEEAAALANAPRLLADANHALGELHGVGRMLPDPNLLVRPNMRREAVMSSRIEGTQTSFSDVVAFEAAGRPGPQTADTREVGNYVYALEHALGRVHEVGLTRDLILEVHRHLLTGAREAHFGTPGEFRTVQNHIGGGPDPADGVFVPPTPDRMQGAIDRLVDYLGEPKPDLPVLVEAAWMHYQFEAIHPFIDGNGRVGRLLIVLLLAARGHLEHPLLYLSPYFDRHRTEYYDHLFAVSAKSGWAHWLGFFLTGVLVEATSLVQVAERMLTLRDEWHGRLDAAGATPSAHRLADLVLQHVAVTARTVETMLGVSNPTAYNTIRALDNADILDELTGRPRGRVYASKELLSILATPE